MAMVNQITFSDNDVINTEDFIPRGESNMHNVRPWLLHDCGFVLCVVFADCLQEAIDIAVDNNKLDRFLIDEKDYGDYGVETENPTCTFLGNAGEPFDIESLGYVELDNPPFSFAAMWEANQ
jgi:hypothetical protein